MYSFYQYSLFLGKAERVWNNIYYISRECKNYCDPYESLIELHNTIDHDPFIFKNSFIEFKD